MAIKALNSVAGFSVGEVPANIILANGDITSTNGNFTANVSAGNILTNNLLYANGTAWDLGGNPGGSNTYIQFNDNGEFGGVSNFTFNKATNVLTVTGNIAGTNVNAGNLLTANFVTGVLTTAEQPNITSVGTLTSLVVGNGTANVTLTDSNGNGFITATGNITAANFIGNIVGNISGNIVIPGSNTGVVFNDGGNANTSTAFTFNKSSNLVTVTANANVGNLNTGGVVSATGNVTGGNLVTAGNVFASAIVQNASTYDTRVSLSSTTGIVQITSDGNTTKFNPSGQIELGGASQVVGGTFGGSGVTLGASQTDIFQNRGGNVTVQVGTGGSIANTWTFAQGGAFEAPGLVNAVGNINGANLTTGGIVQATGNVNGANFNTTGTANVGNLKIANVVEGNLIPSVSNTYSLGNSTYYWKDLFLSGTTITIGDQTISANINGIALSNTTYLSTLNVSGNANVGNMGTAGLVIATGNVTGGNLTTAGQVDATGNVTGGNLNTGGALSATGNANVGNLGTGGLIIATGNITGGNLSTGGVLSVTGNANVGNMGTSGLITATGNITGGNISTGGTVIATGNVETSANVVTDLIVGKTASVSITAVGSNQNINLTPTGTGTVNVGNFIISNVATPVADYDAATKKYVDDVAQGLNVHDAVQAATPATLATITGGTITYNNGTAGVGANLVTTGSFNLIDGVNVQTSGTRILVKNEANAVYNGVYTWANATTIVRATDFNSVPEVEAGDFLFCTGGSIYDNTGWVQTSSPAAIGGAGDDITFTQFSGAGAYTAGTGLALNGGEFSIANTTVTAGSYGNGDSVATFTVNGQGQLTAAANVAITANAANLTGTTLASSIVTSSLTSVGTLTSLAVTGNITGGNVYANTGTIGASLLAGALTTAAQPNVTSLGTLTALGVNGTVTAVNITANTGVFTGNGSGLSDLVAANISGTIANANYATYAGTAYSVSGANVSGEVANANYATYAGTAYSVSGANVTSQVSNALVAGTVYTAAQPNITSVGTLTTLAVSGDITGANVYANTGTIGASLLTGTLTTTDQPNVTSVGSLTGLTVSNSSGVVNFTTTANVTLGAVANLHISGGSSGYVLQTDGAGTLSWVGISSSSISNGNSNVNIPSANGNVNISAVGNANVVVVSGTGLLVNGDANVTGNLTAGNIVAGAGTGGNITGANLVSANYFTGTLTTAAQPNITSVGTLSSLSVTGNISSGNANLGNLVTANFFSGSGNNLSNIQGSNVNGTVGSATTAGTVTTAAQPNITSVGTLTTVNVSGNANVGNLGTGGLIVATGNVTGGNLTTGGAVVATGNVSGGNIVTAGVAVANSGVQISNSAVYFANLTTTATTPNQTIATISLSGTYVTGVEYLVKGVDSTGAKYSVATVVAVSNGSSADYSTFATVNLGGATGTLAVNISSGNIALQVTPASSNSTVWTTQFRVI